MHIPGIGLGPLAPGSGRRCIRRVAGGGASAGGAGAARRWFGYHVGGEVGDGDGSGIGCRLAIGGCGGDVVRLCVGVLGRRGFAENGLSRKGLIAWCGAPGCEMAGLCKVGWRNGKSSYGYDSTIAALGDCRIRAQVMACWRRRECLRKGLGQRGCTQKTRLSALAFWWRRSISPVR